MLTTLKNLVLALINATLILIAACLWLGVSLTDNLRSLTDVVDRSLDVVMPIRDDVSAARAELASLHQSVIEIRRNPGELAGQQIEEILAVLERMDDRLETMETQVSNLTELPNDLVTTAVDEVAAQIKLRNQPVR